MPKHTVIEIPRDILQTILESAKHLCPRETILLLRGKKKQDIIKVTELLVPPLARYGQGFAHLPMYMLPMDLSVVGTAHSHPSGNILPSSTDMNHFFGSVLLIAGSPFTDERNVAIYDREGDKLSLRITDDDVA